MARDDMPPRMRRFLAKPPKRISAGIVALRKSRTPAKPQRGLVTKLARQQGGTCHYCKVRIVSKNPRGAERLATIDHFIPLSRGGTDDIKNLVAACHDCNQRKANKLPADFWREIKCDSGRAVLEEQSPKDKP